ncbi:MAG TPA: hypothetical protein VMC81_06115 [Rhodocyclaceae bacterium]|nr:hypothetical protein [Rhodocyclaceae bacterium]
MIAGMSNLIGAVQRNCHIADARFAREMSLCTYLLEMREFYRWENDLPHGAPLPRDDVGRWITEREALWEGVADDEFAGLPLAGGEHEPFAAAGVNAALLPHGLVYGAGIGRFHKPHFFLGRLARREEHDGLEVLVCDCEYARDLTAIPAALQNGTVIVRREALKQWLWEKAEAWDVKRLPGAMARALAAYHYDGDRAAALARMGERETETLILHERGEHAAGRLLGARWEEMITGFTTRRAELAARSVRDNLADCLSTLPALLAQADDASLHFWFANFDGLRGELFPSLAAAYQSYLATGDAGPLRDEVAAGAAHWLDVARQLQSLDEPDIAALVTDHRSVAL